jgi:uncharacterized protein YicC (UPF0701 family)
LVVYFPTEKKTELGFLIQGPFKTTKARDNIAQDSEANRQMIEAAITKNGAGLHLATSSWYVPAQKSSVLEALHRIIKTITTSSNAEISMACLRIPNRGQERSNLAPLAHAAFMQELTDLQRDVATIKQRAEDSDSEVGERTVARKIAAYKALRNKAVLMQDVLYSNREAIKEELKKLQDSIKACM